MEPACQGEHPPLAPRDRPHGGGATRRHGRCHVLRLPDLTPDNKTTLPTSTLLATSSDGGTTFTERQIAQDFDFLVAPRIGGLPYVGAYEGLSASNIGTGGLTAWFTATAPGTAQVFVSTP